MSVQPVQSAADWKWNPVLSQKELDERFPWYKWVPKDRLENIRFRKDILKWARENREHAQQLWCACSRDLLFWVNTFCFIFEPRAGETYPFITYPYQDAALCEILDAIGHHDLVIEKSRDMGGSWMVLTAFTWHWQFHDGQTFLCVSRKKDLVESPEGNPDSLFFKIDFLVERQPKWLLPDMNRIQMHLGNKDGKCAIDGESTTEFSGVGGRRRALLIDELSRIDADTQRIILTGTRDVTRSRIMVFTPLGRANSAYEVAHNENFRKLSLHWTLHPLKAEGMYRDANGKARSPWYDGECKRAQHPMEIAQELDIDYAASDSQFFMSDLLEKARQDCRPPLVVGNLEFSRDTCEFTGFIQRPGGFWSLWFAMNGMRGRPPEGDYVIGADVSAGSGASNSTIAVVNRDTRTKVAEYVSSHDMPHDFAYLLVATAKWFHNAKVAFDSNGPAGKICGKTILASGYRNLYYRHTSEGDSALNSRPTLKLGFWTGPNPKAALLGDYRRALSEGAYINRSLRAVRECEEYVLTADQRIEHCQAKDNIDPGGAKESHGDIVIADALANLLLTETKSNVETSGAVIPFSSLAGRRQRRLAAERNQRYY